MSRSNAHQAIGAAICESQIFETLIVVSYEFFRMVSDPDYRDITKGYIDSKKYKMPVKSILTKLSERNEIDPKLEHDISCVVEKRHLLVHRWILEKGLPAADDNKGWHQYECLADEITVELRRIINLLSGYMVKWAEPDWARQNPEEYMERIIRLFHDAAKGA